MQTKFKLSLIPGRNCKHIIFDVTLHLPSHCPHDVLILKEDCPLIIAHALGLLRNNSLDVHV